MNLSLIDRTPTRQDLQVIGVAATDIADKMKDQGFALSDTRVLQNSVAYGAVLASLGIPFDEKSVQTVLEHVYTGTKTKFIPANLSAVKNGYRFVAKKRNLQMPVCA